MQMVKCIMIGYPLSGWTEKLQYLLQRTVGSDVIYVPQLHNYSIAANGEDVTQLCDMLDESNYVRHTVEISGVVFSS